MRRREFISLLWAVAWPVGAHGQQTLPIVGYLGTVASDADRVSGFRDGLRQSGYVEDTRINSWRSHPSLQRSRPGSL
jgi:hypothetical protein